MESKNTIKLKKYNDIDPDALYLAHKKDGTKLFVNEKKARKINAILMAIKEKYREIAKIHCRPNVLNVMIVENDDENRKLKAIDKIKKLSTKLFTTVIPNGKQPDRLSLQLHPAIQIPAALKKYKKFLI